MANQENNSDFDENLCLNLKYEWEMNEEETMLPDYEEDVLLDTPEVPTPGPSETESNAMRSTAASSYTDTLPLHQINEEEIILSDYEDDVKVIISDVPSATKTNDMRSTDASIFENYGEDNFIPDYEEDSESDTPEAPVPGPSRTNDMRSTNFRSFKDLFLKADIIKSLDAGGYEHPSQIQIECIPQALSGRDILAQAQSGTGKTLAFILSTLHLLEASQDGVQTLVICPTRELAHQIGKQYDRFSRYLSDTRIAAFFGGLPICNDINILGHYYPQIVVGTVGRILYLIKSNNLDVQYLKHFILDECDQMVQMPNTYRQIQEIYSRLSRNVQVMMFSATLSQGVRDECKSYMKNPIAIYIDDKSIIVRDMVQHYVLLKEERKFSILVQLLDSLQYTQVLIFVKSINSCQYLENLLLSSNYSAIGIHRGLYQLERLKRFDEIENCEKKILVATNVVLRGMNFGGINIVINYDMPDDPDSYLHGVARACRFNTMGRAITFLANEDDIRKLNKVQRRFGVAIPELLSNLT